MYYDAGPSGALYLGLDVIPQADDTYSLGSTGARWKHIYVSTGSVYIGNAQLSATGSDVVIHGNIVPATNEAFNIGSAGARIKELYMSAGTIFIGPTGTLGNDPNGIVYAEKGVAAPNIILGATIPGATGTVGGGVKITLTGPTGPIQYQQLTATGGPTGSIYTLAHNVPGTESVTPSGFTGALPGGTGTVVLGNGIANTTLIAQTSIHIHTHSRMWAMCSLEFTITTNSAASASFYLEVNGDTSNTTTLSWTNGNLNETKAFSINHRGQLHTPATYTISAYGYASGANVASVNHADLFAMGNLA
jgi:hypothetical protein